MFVQAYKCVSEHEDMFTHPCGLKKIIKWYMYVVIAERARYTE